MTCLRFGAIHYILSQRLINVHNWITIFFPYFPFYSILYLTKQFRKPAAGSLSAYNGIKNMLYRCAQEETNDTDIHM